MKVTRRMSRAFIPSLLGISLCALMAGCGEPKRSDTQNNARDLPPPKASDTPAQTPPQTETPPEVSTAELRECVKRVYRGALVVDENRPDSYVVGDFNGDDSQDVAVVVRPDKNSLAELNDELANWTLEDPRKVQLPASVKTSGSPAAKPARITVRQDDLLLAIIHGYKKEGWRNPAATQTYLLENAVGVNLKVEPRREAFDANLTGGRAAEILGDVISETLAHEQGFLYWNGAKYVWHH